MSDGLLEHVRAGRAYPFLFPGSDRRRLPRMVGPGMMMGHEDLLGGGAGPDHSTAQEVFAMAPKWQG